MCAAHNFYDHKPRKKHVSDLATLEELPEEYRSQLSAAGVTPLWPLMRGLLPHDAPQAVCLPTHWEFEALRPLLLRAGELTPVERAERRVLILSGEGYGPSAVQATPAIYLGLQLLLPGEAAPSHRHTPSAVRIAVEGEGASTIVEDEKLPMLPGDLVLTPAGEWHEHVHEGAEPVIWLDALDLPLFVYLEASYAEAGGRQTIRNRPETGEVEYVVGGLRATRSYHQPAPKFPIRRYPWAKTKIALHAQMKANNARFASVDFVNPETGSDILPTLGFSALAILSNAHIQPAIRSASAAFHVVQGSGNTRVNGELIKWTSKDTFSVPAFATLEHSASEDAYLIRIDEAPIQKKLGFYEERPND